MKAIVASLVLMLGVSVSRASACEMHKAGGPQETSSEAIQQSQLTPEEQELLAQQQAEAQATNAAPIQQAATAPDKAKL